MDEADDVVTYRVELTGDTATGELDAALAERPESATTGLAIELRRVSHAYELPSGRLPVLEDSTERPDWSHSSKLSEVYPACRHW